MNKQLTIIYVTYNSQAAIEKSLNKIKKDADKFEVIVVDNSPDDTLSNYLKENYSFTKYQFTGKNLGFGRGNNIGLNMVQTDYALILNPDVEYDSSDILTQLSEHKKLENAVITAPVTNQNLYKKSNYHKPKKVDWVVGAAMMFEMKKLENVGFFDESFFLFFEETDLCKRSIAKGYEIYLFDSLLADHDEGNSSHPSDKIRYLKAWHLAWSRNYFNSKYCGKLVHFRKILSYLLKFSFKYFRYILTANHSKKLRVKASLAGCVSYILSKKAFDENGNPRGLKENLK